MLKYLARYTHRVAISNHRLRSLENGLVSFEWKDYAHRSRTRLMTLDAIEFLRRFLLHVLPTGLVRIRQFGFLSNRVRADRLNLCRALLATRFPSALRLLCTCLSRFACLPLLQARKVARNRIFCAGLRSFPDTS